MMNRSILVGRLTKDVELRYTQTGIAVARFTLAVNRTFTNSSGENEADFIQVLVWRKQAENAAKFLSKGKLAGVDGRIQSGSFEGSDGKRVYTTEVVADSVQFLEPRGNGTDTNQEPPTTSQPSGTSGNYSSGASNQQQREQASTEYKPSSEVMNRKVEQTPVYSDDDLPF